MVAGRKKYSQSEAAKGLGGWSGLRNTKSESPDRVGPHVPGRMGLG